MLIGSQIPGLTTQSIGSIASSASNARGATFSDLLQTAIGNVDGLQASADMKIGDLARGTSNADVGNVMVSVEKADVAFQLMMQVRNKVVSAYQDIEKMQF